MQLFTVWSSKLRWQERFAQLVLGLHGYHSVQVLCRCMKHNKQFRFHIRFHQRHAAAPQ